MNATNKITILFILVSIVLQAQVGINTTTPNTNAELDVFSNNRGLLIPRITLVNTTDFSPLSAHVAGMIVYNTNTAGDVTPGFYYWEGSWKPLKSTTSTTTPTGSGWNLTGNSITASDYLGTNNYFPLIFKVNNTQFARLHPNGGMAFGNGAVASDTNSVAIGTSATTSSSPKMPCTCRPTSARCRSPSSAPCCAC